jgi:hypothetical protein
MGTTQSGKHGNLGGKGEMWQESERWNVRCSQKMTRRGGAGKGSGAKGFRGAEHGQACTKDNTGAVALRAALESAVQLGQAVEVNRQAKMAHPTKCRVRFSQRPCPAGAGARSSCRAPCLMPEAQGLQQGLEEPATYSSAAKLGRDIGRYQSGRRLQHSHELPMHATLQYSQSTVQRRKSFMMPSKNQKTDYHALSALWITAKPQLCYIMAKAWHA